jgi:hypothetical protein
MVTSMERGMFRLSTLEALKRITSSTHFGVGKNIRSTPDVTGDIGLENLRF